MVVVLTGRLRYIQVRLLSLIRITKLIMPIKLVL